MIKRVVSALSAAAMTATMLSGISVSADTVMRDAQTLQKAMGIGINLGNTFECTVGSGDPWVANQNLYSDPIKYEKAWGSPEITQAMIQGIADEGFETLRIPVSWSNMMTGDDVNDVEHNTYTISPDYLARVKQVADWALDAGMYVVINEHYDYGWIRSTPLHEEYSYAKFQAIWEQVGEAFKDYDDHLLFEGENEELGNYFDEQTYEPYWWKGGDGWETVKVENGKQKCYDSANKYNQIFVDTVRKTGGNNSKRVLIFSSLDTNIGLAMDDMFKVPEDPAGEGRLMLQVHHYSPYEFAMEDQLTWGTEQDKADIDTELNRLKKFTDQGIPVFLGECCNGDYKKEKDLPSLRTFFSYVCEAAYVRGITPVLWDTHNHNVPYKAIYDRNTNKMSDQALKPLLNAIPENDKTIPNITAPSEITVKVGESTDIGAKTDANVKLSYTSSDPDECSVDANGKVTIAHYNASSYTITVKTEDTADYMSTRCNVKVNVQKKDKPAGTPESTMTVGKDVASTKSIPLTANWKWSVDKDLPLGEATKAVAIYTGSDKKDYKTNSVVVLITRKEQSVTPSDSKTGNNTVTVKTPDQVKITKASAAQTSVKLTWNKAANASGYKVERYDTKTKKWVQAGTTTGTVFTNKKLAKGKVYKFRVTAYNKSGSTTKWGKASAVKKVLTKPAATKITKKTKSGTAVKLTWKKVSCTGYKVQQYNSKTKKWKTVKTIKKAKTTSYKITKLKKNTSYKFRVLTYKKSGKLSSQSASKTVKVKTKK